MAVMDDLRRDISDFVLRVATEALQETWAETLDAAPGPGNAGPGSTGALRQSIDTTGPVMQGDFIATATISAGVDYAEYTDGGSAAHDIRALQAHGLLVWEGPDGTVFVRGKGGAPAVVHHPGSPGTRWFNGSIDDGEPMASRWERALTQAAA